MLVAERVLFARAEMFSANNAVKTLPTVSTTAEKPMCRNDVHTGLSLTSAASERIFFSEALPFVNPDTEQIRRVASANAVQTIIASKTVAISFVWARPFLPMRQVRVSARFRALYRPRKSGKTRSAKSAQGHMAKRSYKASQESFPSLKASFDEAAPRGISRAKATNKPRQSAILMFLQAYFQAQTARRAGYFSSAFNLLSGACFICDYKADRRQNHFKYCVNRQRRQKDYEDVCVMIRRRELKLSLKINRLNSAGKDHIHI